MTGQSQNKPVTIKLMELNIFLKFAICLTLAALMTPPDPYSQVALAIPYFLVYVFLQRTGFLNRGSSNKEAE